MKKYAISWKSLVTDQRGCGEHTLSYDECKKICDELNKKYPNIEHVPYLRDDQ